MTVDIPQAATLRPVLVYLSSAVSEGCPSRPAYETDELISRKTVHEINCSSSSVILFYVTLGYAIVI